MHQGLLETKFIVTTFMIKFEIFYFTGNAAIYKNVTPTETHTTASRSQKKAKNERHLEL